MPFDFFNTSYLAFGDKITRAFRTLGEELDNANKNIEFLQSQLDYINRYTNRNYEVPIPTSSAKATQGQQLYNIFKDTTLLIKEMAINEDGGITLNVVRYNPNNHIYTEGTGDSGDLDWGWAILAQARSNNNRNRTIEFVQTEPVSNKLFKFRIENGRINISELADYVNIYPSNYCGHYKDVTLTAVDNPHTSTGYETVVTESDVVRFNYYTSELTEGDTIGGFIKGGSPGRVDCTGCGVGYLYEGEKVENKKGNTVYRIDYISGRRSE